MRQLGYVGECSLEAVHCLGEHLLQYSILNAESAIRQYIYTLFFYTINNKHLFDKNNEIHKYKTRNNNNLHHPIANLSKFNKGAHISSINFLTTFLNILNL